MTFATLDGWPVVEWVVTMPLLGIWHAEATIDATEEPKGVVELDATGLTLSGTVTSSSEYGGRIRVRVEAGAGELAKPLPARFFRALTFRQLLAETLSEAGEKLAPSTLLDATVPAWCRAAGPASATVASVAETLGLAWGATDDGLVTLFRPTWADLEIEEAVEVAQEGTSGRFTIGALDLSARPGRTIGERRITCVRHVVSDVVRTELVTEAP